MLIDQHQLRVALSERADGARPELERAEQIIDVALRRAQARTGTRHRRALTGLATAAAVAALVVIPVTVGQRSPAPSTQPAPLSSAHLPPRTGSAAATTTRSAPPATHAAPAPVPPPTTARTTSAPRETTRSTARSTSAPASPGSAQMSTLVNAIGVGTSRSIDWDLRTDAEYVTVQLPGNTHASITAFAPTVGFNASRIAAAQQLTVAGKWGWYGNVSVWPANGKPDPMSGKQDGAVPSVAWQLGSTWVVVQSDDPDITTASQLAALAGSLQVSDRPPVFRLPFTVGYLPTDLTVQIFEVYQAAPGDSSSPSWGLTLGSGSTTVDISLMADLPGVLRPGAATPQASASASASSRPFRLDVSGTGVTDGQLAQVRKSTVTTADPAGSDRSWPTLEEALP